MTEALTAFITGRRDELDTALRAALPVSSLPAARQLNDALDYALFPGGKRLRPVLALLAADLAGLPRTQGLTVACAVEFLHSSSLILDDLPAMDDADLRRNRRALHLVFGEGVAVLAAVALLNQSYALLAQAAHACGRPGAVTALVTEAARCVGADGMVGGQIIDLELRTGGTDMDALASRDLKTTALMRLMMTAGALAGGAADADRDALAEFGECFGRAYQVCDDLLDEVCASELTGKPARQDARHRRATAVNALGPQDAHRLATHLVAYGTARLAARFGKRVEVRLLADAAQLVITRTKADSVQSNAHIPTAGAHTRAASTFES